VYQACVHAHRHVIQIPDPRDFAPLGVPLSVIAVEPVVHVHAFRKLRPIVAPRGPYPLALALTELTFHAAIAVFIIPGPSAVVQVVHNTAAVLDLTVLVAAGVLVARGEVECRPKDDDDPGDDLM